MKIHLIVGPTSTGKTSAAITLAKQTGFTVIVLDRIQCYLELSIGSGRPAAAELLGTKHIYLKEASLDEGIISAELAHTLLIEAVEAHKLEKGVILEGGSISLLNCMAQSSYWNNGFVWYGRRLHLRDEQTFLAAARNRIKCMIEPDAQGTSLLVELTSLWKVPNLRATLQGICGYRYAIIFAAQTGIAVDELMSLRPDKKEDLVNGIAREYLEYAREQEQALPLPVQGGNGCEGPPFQPQ